MFVPTAVSVLVVPSRRRFRADVPLSVDGIVEAALTILRDHGAEALTMRRLASDLDTGPASLYAHVRNRSDLHRLVTTHVLLQMPPFESDPARWQDVLRTEALALHALARHYPGLAAIFAGAAPEHPDITRREEARLQMLHDIGMALDDAVALIVALELIAIARAADDHLLDRRVRESGLTEDDWYAAIRRQLVDAGAADRLPLITAMASQVEPGSRQRTLITMIDAQIAGAIVHPARPQVRDRNVPPSA